MVASGRFGLVVLFSVAMCVGAWARQTGSSLHAVPGMIYLDVVVRGKSGPPIRGLQQQDFTVLDNNKPVTLNSFENIDGKQAQIETVILIDAVNTGYEHVAYERSEVDKYLRSNGGKLPYPMCLAILTDDGVQFENDFSTDGKVLSAALDGQSIGLRIFGRNRMYDDPYDRFDISQQALFQVMAHEAMHPGRKIILWVSPGWPLLADPQDEEFLDLKGRQQIFSKVVRLARMLRLGQITLYSIDPLGTADPGRAFNWETFTNAPKKVSDADWGNVALQAIAIQSGGLALINGNDIAGEMQGCVSDADAYYEFSFAPSLDSRHGEYHRIQVKVARAGATARTRQGYYVQE
jgi:VWFA-related protein